MLYTVETTKKEKRKQKRGLKEEKRSTAKAETARKGKKKSCTCSVLLFSLYPPTGVGSAFTVGIPTRNPEAETLIPPSLLGSGAFATCPTGTLPAPSPRAALAAAPAAAGRLAPDPTEISAPVAESGTTLKASRGASAAIPAFTEPFGAAAFGNLSCTVACSDGEPPPPPPATRGAVIAMPFPLSLSVVESGAPGLICSPSAFRRRARTPDEAAAALTSAAAAAAWPGSTTPAPVVASERPSAPRWIPGAVIPSGPTWRLAAGPEKGPAPSRPGVRVVREEAVGMRASMKVVESN